MKKKSNILLIIMISLLLISCNNKENDKDNIEINQNSTENNSEHEKITYDYYYGESVTYSNPENPKEKSKYTYKLYLLSDNTYWFVSGVDCISYENGTYEKNSNGYKLHEGKTYDCNKCYYESNDIVYELNIDGINANLKNDYININLNKTDSIEELSDFMITYDKKCGEE